MRLWGFLPFTEGHIRDIHMQDVWQTPRKCLGAGVIRTLALSLFLSF